jgi:hypothetical protein
MTRGTRRGGVKADTEVGFTQLQDGSEIVMAGDKEYLDTLAGEDCEKKNGDIKSRNSDLDSLATTLKDVKSMDSAVDVAEHNEAPPPYPLRK